MVWVWQFDGQWWRTSVQVSADPASAPSSGSLPLPLKSIVSPTLHFVDAVGLVIVAWGAVLPESMRTDATLVAPDASVTRSRTVYVPAANVCWGAISVESAKAPLPSKSHAYVSVSATSGSLDPEPSSCTVNGAGPFV